MSLSINTNVQSLNTQRALTLHAASQEKLIARLSSGSRINSASDDAAGQAIAARMTATQRGMSQAARNIIMRNGRVGGFAARAVIVAI